MTVDTTDTGITKSAALELVAAIVECAEADRLSTLGTAYPQRIKPGAMYALYERIAHSNQLVSDLLELRAVIGATSFPAAPHAAQAVGSAVRHLQGAPREHAAEGLLQAAENVRRQLRAFETRSMW